MRYYLIILAVFVTYVAADKPAASSLKEMVSWIDSGKFDNNFFDGDGLVKDPQTEDQKVGGCLLDKIGAITNERGFTQFPNDLKVDLAACCTKGAQKDACLSQLQPAYEALVGASAGKGDMKALESKALGAITAAAKARLGSAQLSSQAQALLKVCPNAPACSAADVVRGRELGEGGDGDEMDDVDSSDDEPEVNDDDEMGEEHEDHDHSGDDAEPEPEYLDAE